MVSPAATSTRAMHAEAPPMIQRAVRSWPCTAPWGSRAGDPGPVDADSDGWRHRRSSGEIHPRNQSASSDRLSSGSSPGPR
jgi:hypothetical protein